MIDYLYKRGLRKIRSNEGEGKAGRVGGVRGESGGVAEMD
jgi:hypothetical protein